MATITNNPTLGNPMKQSLACLTLTLGLLGACPAKPPKEPTGPDLVTLVILGDNDLHGALDGRTFNVKLADGKTDYPMKIGGAEYIADYYAKIRAQNPDRVILLAGGDIFQGTLLSNRTEGLTVVSFLNYIGYDALAVGNHEFDYGPIGELSIPREGATDDPFGALKAIFAASKAPFMGANIKNKDTKAAPDWPNFRQTLMIERAGVKIGIIGLTTESTPTTTQPPNVASLSFESLTETTAKQAALLRQGGAEIVLIVAHAGTECQKTNVPEAEAGCDDKEELPKLLHGLPPNTIDAVVSGHTHQVLANMIADVPVIQAGSNGTGLGRIDLVYDRRAKKLLRDQTKLYEPQYLCREVFVGTNGCNFVAARKSVDGKTEPATFLGQPVTPDPNVTALLKEARETVESINGEVIGDISRPINRAEKGESAMGNLVTDMMRAATLADPNIPDADLAIQNSGGLRADLSAGPFTYGELFEVLPFDNILVTLQITGAQVKKIFELALVDNRVFQVSGVKVYYRSTPKPGVTPSAKFNFDEYTHVVDYLETSSGQRFDDKKTYTLVWNDFLTNGGNGMKVLMDQLPKDVIKRFYNATLRDASLAQIKAKKEPLNSESKPLLDPKNLRLIFITK
jgi:5'-nucleotidase